MSDGCGIAEWKNGGYYCPHTGCLQASEERVAKLEKALEDCQGEAYMGLLAYEGPDPSEACHLVIQIVQLALGTKETS